MADQPEREIAAETASGARYVRERSGDTTRIRQTDKSELLPMALGPAGIVSLGIAVVAWLTGKRG